MKITHILFAILGALLASLFMKRERPIVINNTFNIEAPKSEPKSESNEAEVAWLPPQQEQKQQIIIDNREELFPEGQDPFIADDDIELLPMMEDAVDKYLDLIQPFMGPNRANHVAKAIGTQLISIRLWAQDWYRHTQGLEGYITEDHEA
jgi:hypothetical protein